MFSGGLVLQILGFLGTIGGVVILLWQLKEEEKCDMTGIVGSCALPQRYMSRAATIAYQQTEEEERLKVLYEAQKQKLAVESTAQLQQISVEAAKIVSLLNTFKSDCKASSRAYIKDLRVNRSSKGFFQPELNWTNTKYTLTKDQLRTGHHPMSNASDLCHTVTANHCSLNSKAVYKTEAVTPRTYQVFNDYQMVSTTSTSQAFTIAFHMSRKNLTNRTASIYYMNIGTGSSKATLEITTRARELRLLYTYASGYSCGAENLNALTAKDTTDHFLLSISLTGRVLMWKGGTVITDLSCDVGLPALPWQGGYLGGRSGYNMSIDGTLSKVKIWDSDVSWSGFPADSHSIENIQCGWHLSCNDPQTNSICQQCSAITTTTTQSPTTALPPPTGNGQCNVSFRIQMNAPYVSWSYTGHLLGQKADYFFNFSKVIGTETQVPCQDLGGCGYTGTAYFWCQQGEVKWNLRDCRTTASERQRCHQLRLDQINAALNADVTKINQLWTRQNQSYDAIESQTMAQIEADLTNFTQTTMPIVSHSNDSREIINSAFRIIDNTERMQKKNIVDRYRSFQAAVGQRYRVGCPHRTPLNNAPLSSIFTENVLTNTVNTYSALGKDMSQDAFQGRAFDEKEVETARIRYPCLRTLCYQGVGAMVPCGPNDHVLNMDSTLRWRRYENISHQSLYENMDATVRCAAEWQKASLAYTNWTNESASYRQGLEASVYESQADIMQQAYQNYTNWQKVTANFVAEKVLVEECSVDKFHALDLGFKAHALVGDSCRFANCGANQCLRKRVPCAYGNESDGAASFECTDRIAVSTKDLDTFLIGILITIFSMALFCSARFIAIERPVPTAITQIAQAPVHDANYYSTKTSPEPEALQNTASPPLPASFRGKPVHMRLPTRAKEEKNSEEVIALCDSQGIPMQAIGNSGHDMEDKRPMT